MKWQHGSGTQKSRALGTTQRTGDNGCRPPATDGQPAGHACELEGGERRGQTDTAPRPGSGASGRTFMKESEDHDTGLRSSSLAALRWSAIDVGGRQGIQFVVMLVLARLLSPAEFGLIGMLALFIALATSFVDGGFGSALVQRKEITDVDKSSVFHFNAAMGSLMALTMFAAAPWIAAFYRQPILLPLTHVMAVNLFIGSLGSIQAALFIRRLDFRTPCKAGIVAMIVSGTAAAWMAWKGYGVWSLVGQSIICTTVSTGLLWVLSPWKPTLRYSTKSLRSLFGFGSRLLAAGLLNAFFDRLQLTVIGKAFSAADLGYYTRAYSTQQFPVSLLSAIVSNVTLPVFSRLSGDHDLLKSAVRQAQVGLMIPTLPMMVGLAVVARPLVLVLFGEKWLPSVPYLQVLSFAGIFRPLYIIQLNLVMALGRSDLVLRQEVIKKALIVLGLLATFRISVMAMVWAVLIVSAVCFLLNSYYSKSLIDYGLSSQLLDLAPYAGVSVFTGAVTWAVCTHLSGRPVVQLVSSVLAGVGFYCVMCYLLRLKAYRFAIASAVAICFGRQEVRVTI